MRRAKIVATLGPAQKTYEDVRALIDVGVNVARFNLSHGSHEQHEITYRWVRQAAQDSGRAVGILLDLQGPKIRLETFVSGPVNVAVGDTFTITTRDVPGDQKAVGTTHKSLPSDVNVGDPLLIDDGRVRLRATEVTASDVVTTVEVGGRLSDHKGLNLPGVAVSVPAMSEKDEDDLRWGLGMGFDWVALSFVRSADDVIRVREIMAEQGVLVPIIAKLEKPQAVENLAEVVDAFDGLMVARGDLGVELPLEQVPIVQKRAVELCRRQAKPVIVATQMLESMIENPRPTRAEASDCANAVLDGTDALMLSGETSVGAWPVDAVRTMARIIEATEEQGLERIPPLGTQPHTRGGAITAAAVRIAEQLDISLLATFTQSGDSARRMSRLRPPLPQLTFTPDRRVRNQLALSWGVTTFHVKEVKHTDQMARQVDTVLLESGRAKEGEFVVIIAGSPPGISGSTNALRVHRMGDAIKGLAASYRDDSDADVATEGYGEIHDNPA